MGLEEGITIFNLPVLNYGEKSIYSVICKSGIYYGFCFNGDTAFFLPSDITSLIMKRIILEDRQEDLVKNPIAVALVDHLIDIFPKKNLDCLVNSPELDLTMSGLYSFAVQSTLQESTVFS